MVELESEISSGKRKEKMDLLGIRLLVTTSQKRRTIEGKKIIDESCMAAD